MIGLIPKAPPVLGLSHLWLARDQALFRRDQRQLSLQQQVPHL